MNLQLSHFNGSGKILARAVGVQQAYKILSEYGGQSFWICKEPKPTHSTSIKLGLDAHIALSEFWPEQDFELPMVSHVQKQLRNDEIHQDAKTSSMREMIVRYGITRSQLQAILRSHQPTEQPAEDTQTQQQLKLLDF